MKDKYFNIWKSKQIYNDYQRNPIIAKSEIENYLLDYPEDYSMRTYYAGVLITIGKFAEAKNILESLKEIISKQNSINELKVAELKYFYYYTSMRYLVYNGQYQEFIDLSKDSEYNIELSCVNFYCKRKLNLLDLNRREPNSYIFRQIVAYDENDFIKHIEKHQAEFNNDVDQPNELIFNYDFPINEMLSETKKYIGGDTKIYPGFMENAYVFKYDNCGKVKNKNADYFKVISFNGTDNYITMYPSDFCEAMPCVDLNYLKPNIEKPMIKSLSQIDKFNRRYHIG